MKEGIRNHGTLKGALLFLCPPICYQKERNLDLGNSFLSTHLTNSQEAAQDYEVLSNSFSRMKKNKERTKTVSPPLL